MASSLPSLSAAGAASSSSDADATVYEDVHVHHVYEAIAPHFSATRHKPWPFVSSFLAAQPPGSVGLDVGCGNGKNMGVNHNVVMLGCDRSAALVALARDSWCSSSSTRTRSHSNNGSKKNQQQQQQQEQEPQQLASSREKDNAEEVKVAPRGHEGGPVIIAGADVAVADGLGLPFREGSADFVICIAVIHHLSTRARRIDAIRQLLRCIRRRSDPVEKQGAQDTGGQALVYVWALEQSSSRRGWGEGGEQDLLVPWVMKAPQQKKKLVQQHQQGQASKGEGKKNNKNKNKKNGKDSKDALASSSHAAAAADAAAVGFSGSCQPPSGAAITTATCRSGPENDESSAIPSSGEGGEGERDAVAMQGHRQESHKNNLVVEQHRARDVSRETGTETMPTAATEDDKGVVEEEEEVEDAHGKASGVADTADENAFSAVGDNAKRADDGQQQQEQGQKQKQGQGQGPREKQQQQQQQQQQTEAKVNQQQQPQRSTGEDADKTFHRFYHLYKEGELEEDVAAAGGKVLRSGYERDNWWVIAG